MNKIFKKGFNKSLLKIEKRNDKVKSNKEKKVGELI